MGNSNKITWEITEEKVISNNTNNESMERPVLKCDINIKELSENTSLKVIRSLETSIGKTPKQIESLIDKAESWEHLSIDEINAIDFKIISNNPTIGIFDNLHEWDNYMSIIFSWIKWLNDIFWQHFTD